MSNMTEDKKKEFGLIKEKIVSCMIKRLFKVTGEDTISFTADEIDTVENDIMTITISKKGNVTITLQENDNTPH